MSEPKRYALKVNEENDFDLIEHSNGEYVRYEDYAKLQMERIHDLNQMGGLCEENARLKAEVERLTKQTQWQPIETAPFQPRVRIIVDRNDDGEVGIVYSTDLSYYSFEQYPDWWMPLPVAPAKEGKDKP